MKVTVLAVLAMAVPFSAFGVDGIVLVNQSTVVAAGGFPYTITQPGSYRLAGNLTVPNANTTAILVHADNVTIDLNGFSILGPTVCTGIPVTSCSPTGSGFGIDARSQSGITVVNGVIHGMGDLGVRISGGSVEKLQVSSNGGFGISVERGRIADSIAESNGNSGISVLTVTVIGNMANYNGGFGMFIECPSSVANNTANQNRLTNLFVFAGCALANNSAP